MISVIISYVIFLVFMFVNTFNVDSILSSIPFFCMFVVAPLFVFIESMYMFVLAVIFIGFCVYFWGRINNSYHVIYCTICILIWLVLGGWCFSVLSGGAWGKTLRVTHAERKKREWGSLKGLLSRNRQLHFRKNRFFPAWDHQQSRTILLIIGSFLQSPIHVPVFFQVL